MPYISTEPVESSNLERVGYDRKTSTLRVIFKGRGDDPSRVYDYPMVPEPEYKKLMEAESKGKFFNSRIKPMYAYRTPRPEELEAPPDVPCACGHGFIGQHDCQGGVDQSPPDITFESIPAPFWALVGCDQGCEDQDFACEGEHTTHDHDGIEVHDHEGGDECHVHDADGLPVAVPPTELPRTQTGEVDYTAIPDASHLFPDRDDLLDMPCRCCGVPLRVPPEDACDLCVACYKSKGGDTDDPCSAHAGTGDWKPVDPHEHPQLTSEPDD